MDYDFEFRGSDLVKLDILVNGRGWSLSTIARLNSKFRGCDSAAKNERIDTTSRCLMLLFKLRLVKHYLRETVAA